MNTWEILAKAIEEKQAEQQPQQPMQPVQQLQLAQEGQVPLWKRLLRPNATAAGVRG